MAEKAGLGRKGEPDGVNIQVLLRCRPQAAGDAGRRVVYNEHDASVTIPVGSSTRKFTFDRVFGDKTTQSKLYDEAIQPVVREVLAGFNCTIFAYGQTGTGKTYTMEGGMRDSSDGSKLSDVAGVIPRAINQIFEHVGRIGGDLNTVKCSFLELYNEEATDLLASKEGVKLTIQQDLSQGGDSVQVKGLEEVYVRSAEDIYKLLDTGSLKRRTAATLLNKQSSRSHSVFCVTVQIHELQPDGEDAIRIGKLYLVDLAGSESILRSGATDERAKEAGLINKSLSALGRVINAIVDKTGHIPYRDSKLTRLLADSLGGRTKTCIIATISPMSTDETKNTLEYALRAKNIRNRPEVNQKVSSATHMAHLSAENKRLKLELTAMREKDGVFMPLALWEKEQEEAKADKERRGELEAELEGIHSRHTAEREALEQQVADCTAELDSKQALLEKTQIKLEQAQRGLEERNYLVASHVGAEQDLVDMARSLRRQLGNAAAALEDLFAKVDARTALEGSNAAVVRELQRLVSSHLEGLQSAVAGAMEAQQTRFSTIRQQLEAAAQGSQGAAAALQRQTLDLQSQLLDATAATQLSLNNTAGFAWKCTQAAERLSDEHMRDSDTAAAEAAGALGAAHSSLVDSLKLQASLLTSSAGKQEDEAKAAAAAVLEGVNAGGRRLQDLEVCRTTWQQAMQAELDEQRRALEEAEAASRTALQARQDELLGTVTRMLHDFISEQRTAVNTAFEAARTRASAACTANTENATCMTEIASAVSQQLQTSKKAVEAGREQAAELRRQHNQDLLENVSACQSSGDKLKSEADAALQAQLQREEQLAVSSAQAAAVTQELVRMEANSGIEACESAAERLVASQQKWGETVQGSLQAASDSVAAASASVQEADQLAAGLIDQHDSHKAAFSEGVKTLITAKYREGIPIDDLPQQEEIKLPSEECIDKLRAPAPEVALAHFRESCSSQQAKPLAEPMEDSDMAAEQLDHITDGDVTLAIGSKRPASSGRDAAASPLQTRDPNQPGNAAAQPSGKRRRTGEVA